MPLYVCQLCNFSSKIKTHFRRHLNTNKHKNVVFSEGIKTKKDHEKTIKDHKKTIKDHKRPQKKKYNCDHCGEIYTTFSHKRRHELHYCKKSPYVKEKKDKKTKKKIKKNKKKNIFKKKKK